MEHQTYALYAWPAVSPLRPILKSATRIPQDGAQPVIRLTRWDQVRAEFGRREGLTDRVVGTERNKLPIAACIRL